MTSFSASTPMPGLATGALLNLSWANTASLMMAPNAYSGDLRAYLGIAACQMYDNTNLLNHTWTTFAQITSAAGRAASWINEWNHSTLGLASTIATVGIVYCIHQKVTKIFAPSPPTTMNKVSAFLNHMKEHTPLFLKHLRTFSLFAPFAWIVTFIKDYQELSRLNKPALSSIVDFLLRKNLPIATKLHLNLFKKMTAPLAELVKQKQESLEQEIAPFSYAKQAALHLAQCIGARPSHIGQVGSMLSYMEAGFNLAGKVPGISYLSGHLRSTIGLSMASISGVLGGLLIGAGTLTGRQEHITHGSYFIREYAGKQGLGNFVRGIGEAYVYFPTLFASTAWDLAGFRVSYLGERPAAIHPVPFLAHFL